MKDYPRRPVRPTRAKSKNDIPARTRHDSQNHRGVMGRAGAACSSPHRDTMALRAARLAAHTRAPSSGEAPGKLSSHAREGRLGTGAATSDHRRYAAIRSPSVLLAAAARRLMPLAAASAASAAALLLVRDAALAESLHARRRHLRQILLAHVQPPLAPAELGMRHVARLLWRRAARRRLPHRLAQHVRRGPLHAPHDQVHPRPNLAQRHVRRRRLGALLQLDGILPHPHNAARASAPSVGGAPAVRVRVRGAAVRGAVVADRCEVRCRWSAPPPSSEVQGGMGRRTETDGDMGRWRSALRSGGVPRGAGRR
mmetsp:Transcript_44778/g.145509  ORF Transcript_44778/g.145509 Transcript_44778/m.145509 type:complete len:312 (+) Transcript_44778:46-981(+)